MQAFFISKVPPRMRFISVFTLFAGGRIVYRLEFQTQAVDAVAQSCFGGPVGKNMAQMTAALGTKNFGPNHAVGKIALFPYTSSGQRCIKRRPAAVAVKLALAGKELRATTRTGIRTFFKVQVVLPSSGIFGSFLPKNAELFGAQLCTPFGFAAFNGVFFHVGIGFGLVGHTASGGGYGHQEHAKEELLHWCR